MQVIKTRRPLGKRFWSAYSLRTRYLAVTALVTLVILAGALLAQSYIARASQMRSENLKLRNQASLLIRQLSSSMLDAERNFNIFLSDPSTERQLRVHQELVQAIALQKQLYGLTWFKSSNMAAELDDFGTDMQVLQSSLDHLMESRSHPETRNPFQAIRSTKLQPVTQHFNESIAAVLQQLALSGDEGLRATLLPPLEELRAEWMRSDKLADRYSAQSGRTFLLQAETLNPLLERHKALQTSIAAIEKQLANVPADSPLYLTWQKIPACAKEWSDGLRQLSDLAGGGQRLSDTLFVEQNTAQQFVHIWEYLQHLDVKLEDLSSSDIATLTQIADSTSKALWLLAIFGIALLATGAIYFERSILRPITQVASALRAEALGEAHAPLPDAQSRETHHLIEAFNEMHQQVQQRQQSLEYLALHDTLTGLANRVSLVRAISQRLNSPESADHELALLMIGLNRFKEINNSLGHSVGDQLLTAVAHRLDISTPENTLLARHNGDGFALLLAGSEKTLADDLAAVIIQALEAPFEVENQSLYLSATLGIAFSPEHGSQPLELLQKAEVAMQVAKQQKINLTHYNIEHDRHALHRLALANALRQELHESQNTLSLAYQPQIEVHTGRVCGIEALLRWDSLREGKVTPGELIPIAEQTGLIYQLTPWVLERAFEEFSSMKGINGMKPVLAINLSALNLHDADFPRRLNQLMEKWAIEPSFLEMEITESAMMAEPERAHRTLGQIHAMGIDLTIDDFGTGFSSLTYLKQLPVSKLKIDKSFVISMLQDENDAVIIRSTIDMAHNMGMRVVAEGVENQETYDLLEILDCDIVQGFHISPPRELGSLDWWMQDKTAIARGRTAYRAG